MQRDDRELAGAWTRFQRHGGVPVPAELTALVEGFWSAEWDYPEPYRQKIVPYPNVQVTVRPGRDPEVHGVASGHVLRELAGRGSVAGAAFRPGAFHDLLGGPVSLLTDRVVPAGGVPGLAGLVPSCGVGELRDALAAVLGGRVPPPAGRDAAALVERIAADRSVVRVDGLAAIAGGSVRSLQRLFHTHVGVGPKWVIRRYRLREVTERMAAGVPVRWSDVAAELGYADQAHLTREFTDLFGEPPTAYARRYPPA